MKYGALKQRVIEVLALEPATVGDIAARLGIGRRNADNRVRALSRAGIVEIVGHRYVGAHRPRNIWALCDGAATREDSLSLRVMRAARRMLIDQPTMAIDVRADTKCSMRVAQETLACMCRDGLATRSRFWQPHHERYVWMYAATSKLRERTPMTLASVCRRHLERAA